MHTRVTRRASSDHRVTPPSRACAVAMETVHHFPGAQTTMRLALLVWDTCPQVPSSLSHPFPILSLTHPGGSGQLPPPLGSLPLSLSPSARSFYFHCSILFLSLIELSTYAQNFTYSDGFHNFYPLQGPWILIKS